MSPLTRREANASRGGGDRGWFPGREGEMGPELEKLANDAVFLHGVVGIRVHRVRGWGPDGSGGRGVEIE
jgi:hypothetical protein